MYIGGGYMRNGWVAVALVIGMLVTGSMLGAAAKGSGEGKATLLVVNQGDANLSLVDPVAEKVVGGISEELTDVHGHEVAASPDGQTAYVPIYGSTGVGKPGIDGHEMLVMDIKKKKITGRVDFGSGVRPHCVVYDPVSKMLYVTTELKNSVTIVDPKTLKIVGEIPTGQAGVAHAGDFAGWAARVHSECGAGDGVRAGYSGTQNDRGDSGFTDGAADRAFAQRRDGVHGGPDEAATGGD